MFGTNSKIELLFHIISQLYLDITIFPMTLAVKPGTRKDK